MSRLRPKKEHIGKRVRLLDSNGRPQYWRIKDLVQNSEKIGFYPARKGYWAVRGKGGTFIDCEWAEELLREAA